MKITLDGCGNRGYRHLVAHTDISELQENLASSDGFEYRTYNDSPTGPLYANVERGSSGEITSFMVRKVVDIRTNGSYAMRIELSARDILFLAWIVMRDRSLGWIGEQFTMIANSVVRRRRERDASAQSQVRVQGTA